MKKLILCVVTLSFVLVGPVALAAAISGIGSVAHQVGTNLGAIAKFLTAASYVAGMAFAIGAIVKFKAHKENPTQIPLSTAIVLLFIAAALIFIPMVFRVGGGTLFGASGFTPGISGVSSFGEVQG